MNTTIYIHSTNGTHRRTITLRDRLARALAFNINTGRNSVYPNCYATFTPPAPAYC